MYRAGRLDYSDKDRFYVELDALLGTLIDYEDDWIANLANAAGLLAHQLGEINWAGFYLYRGQDLVLGPFCGKPACSHIDIGEGVCGAAAAQRQTLVITDVHTFPGHIACDEASQAEIVVPLLLGDRLLGVLDIDAPVKARFDDRDAAGLEAFVSHLVRVIDWAKVI